MGISTDAILAYGYDLGDDPDVDWWANRDEDDEEESDFGEVATNKMLESIGFTEKWVSGIDDEYFTRKRNAEGQLGVEIIYHCSYDYPMYILAAKEIRAYRGDVTVIEMSDLLINIEWDDKLARALQSLGIKPINEYPQWMLVSMWG
jgi:hypothetical protein